MIPSFLIVFLESEGGLERHEQCSLSKRRMIIHIPMIDELSRLLPKALVCTILAPTFLGQLVQKRMSLTVRASRCRTKITWCCIFRGLQAAAG